MKDTFERRMAVGLPLADAWTYLHDVDALASCSSYLQPVEVIEDGRRWSTVLQDRVGPFRLSAPVVVEILDERDLQSIEMRASGQDRGLGTRLRVDAAMQCRHSDDGDGTALVMRGTYDVTGRVAALGAAVVRRQAGTMIDEFWRNLEALLGTADR
jgi:carbon monoxide dehydrogenase subunit G